MATTVEKIAQEAAELTKQERLTLVRDGGLRAAQKASKSPFHACEDAYAACR